MATDDDDILTGAVPDPDAEMTPSERIRAKNFAELVDKASSGRAPAAMSHDDRALLEMATVIRATHGKLELPAAKTRSIVEDALRQAIGAGKAPVVVPPSRDVARDVTPITSARRSRAPWLVAATTSLAAAAAIILWLRAPSRDELRSAQTAAATRDHVKTAPLSRSDDALIGPIAREHSGDASQRIDAIFADRLDGFRDRRLSPGPRRGGNR